MPLQRNRYTMIRHISFGLALLSFHATAVAQCAPQVAPVGGYAGADGLVYASVAYDPDGAGPLAPQLLIGGDFHAAGTVIGNGIAAQDQSTGAWSSFGAGLGGTVRALAVMPSGDLVAGGWFPNVGGGGGGVNCIARWNGMAWTSLGAGIVDAGGTAVMALAVIPNGDLVAGGNFLAAGGVTCRGIARWDGVAWSPLAGGTLGAVYALAVMPNGDLAVGGNFSGVNGGSPSAPVRRHRRV